MATYLVSDDHLQLYQNLRIEDPVLVAAGQLSMGAILDNVHEEQLTDTFDNGLGGE